LATNTLGKGWRVKENGSRDGMLKIKKDDEVVVIAGRDKGRRGEVMRVLKDGRLMVAGINMVKKHKRPNPNAGEQGGIIAQEAPIQASNVAIWNDEDERADRVGVRVEEDGKKVRFFKSNGKVIEG
jgi:large subunit ribosomal protein L24|tara:strand:- start:2283 stop:2660 length:378 start_codon:yes stop_codon:yes gene_type:complete